MSTLESAVEKSTVCWYDLNPPKEVQELGAYKMFRLFSRAGGAVVVTAMACSLAYAGPDAPLKGYIICSYLFAHGAADLISGKHHFLPIKTIITACRGLYNLFKK